jgi:hypothetical protein
MVKSAPCSRITASAASRIATLTRAVRPPGQLEELFNALTCSKTFITITADEGAGEHCHVGARTLFYQQAFDWLDDVLCR